MSLLKCATYLPCIKLNIQSIVMLHQLKTNDSKWNRILNEAEKVVGYPTSFLSLRWILNDEVANIAAHLRKLVGTSHPLLKTAKNLMLNNDLTWGLIVLLVAKVAGLKSVFPEVEHDRTAGILHSQRIVAEITEMLRTSNLMHKGLLNLGDDAENKADLNFGNKLALLSGDYLLSKCFKEAAELKNHRVQEIISFSLRDLAEAEFLGLRDKQNLPIPCKPLPDQSDIILQKDAKNLTFKISDILGKMKAEWTLRTILTGASLLGHSCKSVLILAQHDEEFQRLGYEFGENFGLSWQAAHDRRLFEREHDGPFSLVSAPVMFHLQHDPNFYKDIEKGLENVNDVDFGFIKQTVLSGPGLERTIQLQKGFSQNAIDILNRFNDSESKQSLLNIIKSL